MKKTRIIWDYRNLAQTEKEKNNDINKDSLKTRKQGNRYIDKYRKINVDNLFGLEGLVEHISTGRNIFNCYDKAPTT